MAFTKKKDIKIDDHPSLWKSAHDESTIYDCRVNQYLDLCLFGLKESRETKKGRFYLKTVHKWLKRYYQYTPELQYQKFVTRDEGILGDHIGHFGFAKVSVTGVPIQKNYCYFALSPKTTQVFVPPYTPPSIFGRTRRSKDFGEEDSRIVRISDKYRYSLAYPSNSDNSVLEPRYNNLALMLILNRPDYSLSTQEEIDKGIYYKFDQYILDYTHYTKGLVPRLGYEESTDSISKQVKLPEDFWECMSNMYYPEAGWFAVVTPSMHNYLSLTSDLLDLSKSIIYLEDNSSETRLYEGTKPYTRGKKNIVSVCCEIPEKQGVIPKKNAKALLDKYHHRIVKNKASTTVEGRRTKFYPGGVPRQTIEFDYTKIVLDDSFYDEYKFWFIPTQRALAKDGEATPKVIDLLSRTFDRYSLYESYYNNLTPREQKAYDRLSVGRTDTIRSKFRRYSRLNTIDLDDKYQTVYNYDSILKKGQVYLDEVAKENLVLNNELKVTNQKFKPERYYAQIKQGRVNEDGYVLATKDSIRDQEGNLIALYPMFKSLKSMRAFKTNRTTDEGFTYYLPPSDNEEEKQYLSQFEKIISPLTGETLYLTDYFVAIDENLPFTLDAKWSTRTYLNSITQSDYNRNKERGGNEYGDTFIKTYSGDRDFRDTYYYQSISTKVWSTDEDMLLTFTEFEEYKKTKKLIRLTFKVVDNHALDYSQANTLSHFQYNFTTGKFEQISGESLNNHLASHRMIMDRRFWLMTPYCSQGYVYLYTLMQSLHVSWVAIEPSWGGKLNSTINFIGLVVATIILSYFTFGTAWALLMPLLVLAAGIAGQTMVYYWGGASWAKVFVKIGMTAIMIAQLYNAYQGGGLSGMLTNPSTYISIAINVAVMVIAQHINKMDMEQIDHLSNQIESLKQKQKEQNKLNEEKDAFFGINLSLFDVGDYSMESQAIIDKCLDGSFVSEYWDYLSKTAYEPLNLVDNFDRYK